MYGHYGVVDCDGPSRIKEAPTSCSYTWKMKSKVDLRRTSYGQVTIPLERTHSLVITSIYVICCGCQNECIYNLLHTSYCRQ